MVAVGRTILLNATTMLESCSVDPFLSGTLKLFSLCPYFLKY